MVMLLSSAREMPDSSLGRKTVYPDFWIFVVFLSSVRKILGEYYKLGHILSIPLFVRSYLVVLHALLT
jgi:hypothetical protein